MSLLYLKSKQFLRDENGNIISSGSQLPYLFTNSFADPIRVNKNSTIELVSADLNVSPFHKVGDDEKNNVFTYIGGQNTDGFLQKPVKIPDGSYSNDALASKITTTAALYNNMDTFEVNVDYEPSTDSFEITVLPYFDPADIKTSNSYQLLNSKMGFQATTGEMDAGVGTFNTTCTIFNRNTLADENTLIHSNVINATPAISFADGNKPPNLISNMITPLTNGLLNGAGSVCSICSPLKFYKFTPATFFTNSTGKTFEWTLAGASQGTPAVLVSYGGSNGYDFCLPYGGAGMSLMFLKIVDSQTYFNTLTLPNSTTTTNLPFGHFLIGNTSDTAIDTTLTNNANVWQLNTDGDELYWEYFHNASGGTSTIKCTSDTDYIASQAALELLGNWGSSSLSLTRGETAILESESGEQNQVNTTNRWTRARVYNTTNASGNSHNDNMIFADYSLQIRPSKTGTSTYVNMNYGTQDAAKKAGETDWISLTEQGTDSDKKLSAIFIKRAITTADNIMLIANITEWLCVKFFIAHDTGGNLIFDDVVELGNTEAAEVSPPAIHLPMNFSESSYPIMPVVGLQTPFIGNGNHQQLVFGEYSKKSINDFSLAALYKRVDNDYTETPDFTARQPKQTTTGYCKKDEQIDKEFNIEPNGFNGKGTFGSVIIPDATFAEIWNYSANQAVLIRMGGPITTAKDPEEYDEITNNGWNIKPNKLSKLNLNLGFPKIITNIDNSGDIDPPLWKSTNAPMHESGQNFIVNLDNLGRLEGQNSATQSKSQMVGIIPNGELTFSSNAIHDKHYKAQYPLPVKVNAKGDESINNFNVFITNDDGTPAYSLAHPTNLLLKLNN